MWRPALEEGVRQEGDILTQGSMGFGGEGRYGRGNRSKEETPTLTYAHAVVFGSVHGHPSTPIFVFCSLTGFICTSGLPCPHLAQSRFWMTLSTEGTAPIPRDSHVSVIHGQSMYVFGGSTGSAMNDFHELRLDKCRWQQVGDGSLVARFRLAL